MTQPGAAQPGMTPPGTAVEIFSVEELLGLTDDTLVLWTAQGLTGGGRAWAGEDAVIAAAPGISTRDRVGVWARSPQAAVALAREVLPQLPRSFRPFGERPLIAAIAAAVPGLEVVGHFGWMDARETSPAESPAPWLDDTTGVNALLDLAYPASYARAGVPGVERWAGFHDDADRLLAIGALAWSSPQVALLSGIAVAPDARGKGLALPICATLAQAGLAERGTVALMVEDHNTTARRVYDRLGLRHRPVSAAAFT
ncbi:GNAT family N-acetyltransferase [Streptacidiphilus jiangxiensis]|uniref:FR47-like protein n=1 Tax=Streptacidiphilus jiangxiensis TaxID=235985 RepID=A0A1H7MGC2_STRJI|nr:GNAT family N-acetyltransferase [Streptacidiphilus jiangxiensis]SEL10336.1 FR47-like protein [Streptacidiphilus jiangxiensis]